MLGLIPVLGSAVAMRVVRLGLFLLMRPGGWAVLALGILIALKTV
jgi:hypothetical protein